MKRIYFTLTVLFLVIAGMAYLYFSSLNTDAGTSDLSLKVAAQRAAVVYRIQNDKSVLDILDGQQLLSKLIGAEKSELLQSIRETILSDPAVALSLQHKTIYLSILPGTQHNLDFMICTQLSTQDERKSIMSLLSRKRDHGFNSQVFSKIALPNTPAFFVGFEKNVLVIASSTTIFSALGDITGRENNPFSAFILSNDKLTKNSLANLYINYAKLPDLLKAITPDTKTEELTEFQGLNAYSHFSYNFSKTNIFFNGETQLNNNSSYFGLFLNTSPQKLEITSILPQHTASYTLYNTGNFVKWSSRLRTLFDSQQVNTDVIKRIKLQNKNYHVVLDDIFPRYTNDQFITFQLQQGQKLGAIRLTNGDKVSQLLLDLSNDVDGTIRQFKEDGMLYYYFGLPFKKFSRPYYVIKDNYLFCSNYPSNLQEFLNDYQNNKLLTNEPDYLGIMDQLPNTASVLYYLNVDRSAKMINKLIYPSFTSHIQSKVGLRNFNSFIFQITANKESFQTNLLIPSNLPTIGRDSL